MKRIVKGTLRHLGWELRRFEPLHSEWARLVRMLASHRVNVVFDVGANTGQYAKTIRDAGFAGRIISFEPLAGPHAELIASARHDPLWTAAPRMAIGDREGVVQINVSSNTASSSILAMHDTLLQAEPDLRYVATETVALARLDRVAAEYLRDGDIPYLKVDVQGYESAVLDGAPEVLARAAGLEAELSLVPLYEGQDLWLSMIGRLEKLGFQLWSLVPGFADERSGRLLQCDGIFFRPGGDP